MNPRQQGRDRTKPRHIHSYVPFSAEGYDVTKGRTELLPEAEEQRVAFSHARDQNSAKIIVIGDSGVGKTALIRRIVEGSYDPNYKATIGVDFLQQHYEVFGIPFLLSIWDTAGQERYQAMTRTYYNNSQAAILVYDVNDSTSFESITTRWLPELRSVIHEKIPLFLVGNKSDLVHYVSEKEATALALKEGMEYWPMSVKENAIFGKNGTKPAPVQSLFDRVSSILVEQLLTPATPLAPNSQRTGAVSLGGRHKMEKQASSKGCCSR
eukprot:Sspe_Gene.101231::Locus_75825_Transcript_1_1_Confidence_1.000_Length_952::g.101231::m.101231/K07921/RAB34; Ras-related protein Rab-34